MSAFPKPTVSNFAADVSDGLSASEKHIAPQYLFDEVGASLFDTVTIMPEYGIGPAENRVLRRHGAELESMLGPLVSAANLGWRREGSNPVSSWLEAAQHSSTDRRSSHPTLLKLPGGLIGDLSPAERQLFLDQLRHCMRPGDYLLLSADLVKDIDKMLSAYDDGAGIVAAFNKNILARINRELGGHFNLRLFSHEACWDAFMKRVGLGLVSHVKQQVYVAALGQRFSFEAGETIRTMSAHKFSELELEDLALRCGYRPVKTWIDIEWAFAEALWTV
jgi:uncharacterized SAM-dependent methyltransferase